MRLSKLAVTVMVLVLLATPLQAGKSVHGSKDGNNSGSSVPSLGMSFPCIDPNGETQFSMRDAHKHLKVDPLKSNLSPQDYDVVYLALKALRDAYRQGKGPANQSDFNAAADAATAGGAAALAKAGIDVTNYVSAQLLPPLLRNSDGSVKMWSALDNSKAGQTITQKENVTTTEEQTVTVYMCRCAGCSHWSGTPILKTYDEFLRDWASGAISLTWGNPATDGYRCCTPVPAGTQQRTVSVTKLEDVPVAKVYGTVSFPQQLSPFHDQHVTLTQWRTSVPTQVYMCRCAGCSHWSGTPIHKTYAEFLRDWASGAISLSWGNPATDGYRCCTPVPAGVEDRPCPASTDPNWADCWQKTNVDQWVWQGDVPSNQISPKTGDDEGANSFINGADSRITKSGPNVVSIPTDQSGNFLPGLVQGGSPFQCTDDHGNNIRQGSVSEGKAKHGK